MAGRVAGVRGVSAGGVDDPARPPYHPARRPLRTMKRRAIVLRQATSTRRHFLRDAGTLVAVLGAGVGCGSPTEDVGDDPASAEDATHTASGECPRPQQISFATAGAFTVFNPATSAAVGDLLLFRQVFEPLLDFNFATQVFEPVALEALPERAADREYRALLRSDMLFHNGTPVTADDVAFTFSYYKDEATGSFLTPFLALIEEVIATGARDITFRLSQDYADFFASIAVPYILPRAAVESDVDSFVEAPVGSGPFRFDSSEPGRRVQLASFQDYAGARPASLRTLALERVPEESTRATQLLAGQLDIIDDPPLRDMRTLDDAEGVTAGAVVGSRYLALEPNQCRGPISDVRVRQAIMYAMDRQAIIDNILLGEFGEIADSMIPPWHPLYTAPDVLYRPDHERARSLLNEAGYADGVEFEMLVASGSWVQDAGQLIASQLSEVGMSVRIQLTEAEAGYGRIATGNYDLFLVGPISTLAFGSVAADTVYRAYNYGDTRDGFFETCQAVAARDRRYDELVDAARVATENRQVEAYKEVQNLFSEVIPHSFPLIWVSTTAAWQDYVRGLQVSPAVVPALSSVSTC